MAGVIVLDASVLIALHDAKDAHHSWARDFFAATLDSEWAIPVLTLAETFVHPVRASALPQFLESIAGLGLRTVGLSGDAASSLAILRAESNLRMPDAVVVHTALSESADLATCDEKLARFGRDRHLGVFAPSFP